MDTNPNEPMKFLVTVMRKRIDTGEQENAIQLHNDYEFATWNAFMEEQEIINSGNYGAWSVTCFEWGKKRPIADNARQREALQPIDFGAWPEVEITG